MAEIGNLIAQYGYSIVVAVILFEQLGLPLPATPTLLALGAVAGMGRLSLAALFTLGVASCVAADSVWFVLGRRYGNRIVRFLCRLSLEPDDCARRSGDLYHRYGAMALVVAKFIPGLNAIAAPLAGLLRLPTPRFLLFDSLGASLWIGTMLMLGFVFHDEVELLAEWASRFGIGMLVLVLLALGGYLALKLWIRHRFVSRVRAARIDPLSVWARLRAGESLTIVDLRHRNEIEKGGCKLPGAIQILPEDLTTRRNEIPSNRELILYCSCPNEATSARSAMRLQSMGFGDIRPLLGGFDGWVQAGLPVESLRAPKFGSEQPLMYSNRSRDELVTSQAPDRKTTTHSSTAS